MVTSDESGSKIDDYNDYQCHDRTGLADHMRKNVRRNMVSGISTNQYFAITDCALGNELEFCGGEERTAQL